MSPLTSELSAPFAWCATLDVGWATHCRLRHRVSQEEFVYLDPPLALEACGHNYHLQCIVSWVERSRSNRMCPLCGAHMQTSQLGG
jgi:hypothetical protein